VKRTEIDHSRGDLYFGSSSYEDALRLYCKALFDSEPSFKVGYEYIPTRPSGSPIRRHGLRRDKLATRVVGVPQTCIRGYCYGKLSRVKEAIMAYQAFIQLFPSDALRPWWNETCRTCSCTGFSPQGSFSPIGRLARPIGRKRVASQRISEKPLDT